MTLSVVFHELAEAELIEAAAYYSRVRPGLGHAFIDEVERAVSGLANAPLVGKPVAGDIRLRLLRRFPYSIFYRLNGDHIRILAIAHHKRRPSYWHGRT